MTDWETPVSQVGAELHHVSTVLASVSGRGEGTGFMAGVLPKLQLMCA